MAWRGEPPLGRRPVNEAISPQTLRAQIEFDTSQNIWFIIHH